MHCFSLSVAFVPVQITWAYVLFILIVAIENLLFLHPEERKEGLISNLTLILLITSKNEFWALPLDLGMRLGMLKHRQ